MYTVYVEQQYPTSTLNKYLDYLLYQEQLKKEQEALYYYRLRQQQQRAYLQEVQRRRQQEQERKLILAILEQQQLHQQKLRQQRLLQEQLRQQQILQQEKLRQQQILQQEKLRQQRLLQEKLRQQRLYQLEQQKKVSNCSFVCQDDEEDNERLAQLVEFLFGPEEATPRQQEPEKNVLTLDEFLDYIAKKASELDHDEQGPSSSKPVTEKEESKNVVVTIPITEPAATEEVSKSADAIASEEVSHDSVVSKELPVNEPVVSESQEELSTSELVVSESQEELSTSEPVVSESQEEVLVSEPAVSKPQEETVADEEQQEPQENDESIPEADPIVASVQSLTDGVSAIHVDNQLLTTDEFVDYIANKSRELFEEKPADEEKQEKLKLLQGIQEELEDIRKDNEQHILNTQLDFSQSDDDSVSATTAENREFLGYEDQIMKVLLKLDTVESDGDDEIRTERKNLVKLAEKMLDRLDEFKQKEWERASISSHSEVEEDDYLYV